MSMNRFGLVLVGLMVAALSIAKGGYFPAANPYVVQQGIEAKPTTPFQRAVLKFDGHEEVMIVQSVLNAPTGQYGWVVPLPTKPSYVKAVDPQYTDASFSLVQPPIKTNKPASMEIIGLGALLTAAVALTSGLRHRNKDLAARILWFVGEVFMLGVLAMIFFPVFAQAKYSAKNEAFAATGAEAAKASYKNMDVQSLGTIGSYDVSVISGTDVSEIVDWLQEHKMDVDEKSLPIMREYTKEGWCFLAAEIRKDDPGSHPPHPLKAVFPTDKLIYPMRLTGTQDAPIRLDLLVVSDRQAEVKGMDAWVCDNRDLVIAVGLSPEDKETFSDWHNGLYAMAKRGMVWTYLRGDFAPSQMHEDLEVKFKPMERFQLEVWDREAAKMQSYWLFLAWISVISCIVGLILICWKNLTEKIFVAGAATAILIAITAAGTWYRSIEKVETDQQTYYKYNYNQPIYD